MPTSQSFETTPRAPSAPLQCLPVDGYRLAARTMNGVSIVPLPCKRFTQSEVSAIAAVLAEAGFQVVTRSDTKIRVIDGKDIKIDDIPEPYTSAQRRRDQALNEREARHAARVASQQAYLCESHAGNFVQQRFGDSLNAHNAAALARFLSGDAKAFDGLLSRRAADVLADMGIATEARPYADIVNDLKAVYLAEDEGVNHG